MHMCVGIDYHRTPGESCTADRVARNDMASADNGAFIERARNHCALFLASATAMESDQETGELVAFVDVPVGCLDRAI